MGRRQREKRDKNTKIIEQKSNFKRDKQYTRKCTCPCTYLRTYVNIIITGYLCGPEIYVFWPKIKKAISNVCELELLILCVALQAGWLSLP